jgi:hypothetical protein
LGGLYSLCLRVVYIIAIYFFMKKMVDATENGYDSVDIQMDWAGLAKEQ